MNISQLQEFFQYISVFDPNPQFLVDEIIARASIYMQGSAHIEAIQKTYEFTKAAHEGVARLSGEPYIVHPLQATLFLMDIKPDTATIQACILHDVIEDTDITYETIAEKFGKEVADLCEWLVKVSNIRYRGEERHIETLKKTFLAMGKDLRVIFIKLADRVHNIQTLHFHPNKEKRERIAQETLQIYVPIAKRLGLYHYQQLLENGAFRILYPEEFSEIMEYLDKRFPSQHNTIEEGVATLQKLLATQHVPFFAVTWRLKSPYRIREKMHNKYKSMDFGNINDMIAFRIITQSVGDCYNILGIVHHHFTPLIKKIKDYISMPKFNEYRSLHTTVLWLYDFPVEIQIRTKEMDEVADWWVAAHFAYAENKWSLSVSERQATWIKKLQDLVASYTTNDDKKWFKDELNIELLDRNIFVYTQKGDIIELPEGSTVLDFAFRIHSDLGLKFQNAIVNGSIVPIWYKLKTGDIVLIAVFKNKWAASWNWFEYLHTPSAKAKLTKFLRTKERTQLLERSMKSLEDKLKEYNLPALHSKQDLITKEYKWEFFDRLLLQLLDKQMWYITFIKKIYKKQFVEKDVQPTRMKQVAVAEKPEVIVDGWLRLGYFLCPECRPQHHDKIIARSWKDGLKIHRVGCIAISSVSPEKLLEAHWHDDNISRYTLSLKLQCQDKSWVLLDLFNIFTTLTLNITHIHSEPVANGVQNVYITADTSHPSKLSYFLQEIKKRNTTLKMLKKEIE
jgi:GTP diphosphokinase / guanosine-3',5'-bis(diphosphate) 3'-diphosphatase